MSASLHSDAFLRARRWSLGAVMFCYLFYYTGRQTFGFAMPGIEAELKLDKQTLGWISAAMLWAYAVGQMINGNLGDKFGGRRMMCLGAIASFVLNWITSFGVGFRTLAVAWGANGLAQSMGWAPGSRLVSNWFGARERGRAFGFFVLAAGMSSVLAYVTSLLILEVFSNWALDFSRPSRVDVTWWRLVVWFVARDRPSDLGFAELPDDANSSTPAPAVENETAWQRYGAALQNGRLLLACLSIGFHSAVRYGLLIWVPVYFLGKDFKYNPSGKWISIALPVGMALGALASGWISDRFCQSRRSGVIASFMALAAVSAMGMYFLPAGHFLGVPVLFLAGFFAYGPQSAFWALAPDLLGRARAGTGVGVMNCFAYAMAGLGEPFIGWMTNPFKVPGADDVTVVFPVVAAFGLCSALIALLIRR